MSSDKPRDSMLNGKGNASELELEENNEEEEVEAKHFVRSEGRGPPTRFRIRTPAAVKAWVVLEVRAVNMTRRRSLEAPRMSKTKK
jgi:hypothetical protein